MYEYGLRDISSSPRPQIVVCGIIRRAGYCPENMYQYRVPTVRK